MAIKAKVIATGEIVDVYCYDGKWVNMQNRKEVYMPKEIDINYDKVKPYNSDYWTRLEHQYAGMAMQGLISDSVTLIELGNTKGISTEEATAEAAFRIAHALVKKLKEE